MLYFFILGNNPTLSVAEICAVFKEAANGNLINEKVFIMKANKEVNAVQVIKKMGGIIKIGMIKEEVAAKEDEILEAIKKILDQGSISGKFNFGISNYGVKNIKERKVGMKIKRYLAESKINSRLVVSREPILSSVVVEQNQLISHGWEIVLLPLSKKMAAIGKTLAVQPFKELSFRDYGRPARDDYRGMLPPKLAQIMINLSQAKAEDKILDPFCGSGTILTEAALMGYKYLYGSDISQKAIENTRRNMEWTMEKFKVQSSKFKINVGDSRKLVKYYRLSYFDAIVTEPYLGPARGGVETTKIKRELEILYSQSLKEFYKVLKPKGRVVMVWPVLLCNIKHPPARQAGERAGETHNTYATRDIIINPYLGGFKIINPVPKNLEDNKVIQLTNRNTIIYGRPGQKIGREIVVLER